MFSDRIEKMKHEYTDKYVLVDAERPELARFRDIVGRVKTVNMNGRALVEFDEYHTNIGWFDIDPSFLKVLDGPLPKLPKAEKKATPKEAKPAAAKAAPAKAAGGKPSVADILAAARGKATASAKPTGEKAAPAKAASPAAKPAGASAKLDRSKMSVADMLAAARAGGATQAGAAPAAAEAEEAAELVAESAPAAAAPTAKATGEIKPVDKSKMTVEQMVAYCREHDSN